MIISDGDADSGDSGDCIFRWIMNPHLAHPPQLSHRALQSVTPSDQAEIYWEYINKYHKIKKNISFSLPSIKSYDIINFEGINLLKFWITPMSLSQWSYHTRMSD